MSAEQVGRRGACRVFLQHRNDLLSRKTCRSYWMASRSPQETTDRSLGITSRLLDAAAGVCEITRVLAGELRAKTDFPRSRNKFSTLDSRQRASCLMVQSTIRNQRRYRSDAAFSLAQKGFLGRSRWQNPWRLSHQVFSGRLSRRRATLGPLHPGQTFAPTPTATLSSLP